MHCFSSITNAFCRKIESDIDEPDMADLMLSKRFHQNILSSIVHHVPIDSFKIVQNLSLHPKYSYKQLEQISVGSYQIRLAKSYCQAHVKANNNAFIIKVCDDIVQCKKYCGKLLTRQSKPLLLHLNLRSRFSSTKTHKPYVLLDLVKGKFTVKAYCCSCQHGCRTVGCCGHVMLIIWFTLGIDTNSMEKLFPSSKLDHTFDKWSDEYFDQSESDLNLSTDSSLNLTSTDSSLNLASADSSSNSNIDPSSNDDS